MRRINSNTQIIVIWCLYVSDIIIMNENPKVSKFLIDLRFEFL